MRARVTVGGSCEPPALGPIDRPETMRQIAPALWAAACELVARDGLVHGEAIYSLAVEHKRHHTGENLIKALCHPDGPARWYEYAPTRDQLAFMGLGPSAVRASQTHPKGWYIARK